MDLPVNLVSDFVNATNDEKKINVHATLYGTVVNYNDTQYVRLDGTELLTPISTTVEVSDGDRVAVDLGDHAATVTGNLSSPATTADSVNQRLNIVLDVVNNQIVAKVEASEEKMSQLIISEDAIRLMVQNGAKSAIDVFADSLSLSSNGSTIVLSRDGAEISSGSINLNGYVTFTNLNARNYTTLTEVGNQGYTTLANVRTDLRSTNTTTINGAKIDTGEINANAVTFEASIYDSEDKIYKGGGVKAGKGHDGTKETYGAKLYGYGENFYCLATNAGVGFFRKAKSNETKSGTYLYIIDGAIVASGAIKNNSDRRLKKNISTDLSRYEEFFMRLEPVYFKYIDGTSDRYHTGFIAQDVERALLDSDLTTQDFAAFVIEEKPDGTTVQGLRYSEFISLNTYMIQKTRAENAVLKQELAELRAEVEELKSLIKGG